MERLGYWIVRLLAGCIGLGMVAAGLAKLAGAATVAGNMAKIHFVGPMLRGQGAIELLLGVLTLIPPTRNLGLVGLLAVFTGAIAAHLGAGQAFAQVAPATVALVLTAGVFVTLNLRALGALLFAWR